jgi:beta-phosphoglucomutase-like phosphatase (HAD superfamily)
MNAARAVLWDMDGTLVDSEELNWISWRETMANEGVQITYEQFLSSFGRRNDSTLPRWLGAAATSERVKKISTAKDELYRKLVRTEGDLASARRSKLGAPASRTGMASGNRFVGAARTSN